MMTKFIPNDQEKVVEDAAIQNKRNEAIDSPHLVIGLKHYEWVFLPSQMWSEGRGKGKGRRCVSGSWESSVSLLLIYQ